MKNILILCFILLSFTSAFAQNVNVSDYQVPVSQATTLRINGDWNWSQTADSVISNRASLNSIYRTFYSSLPLAWFINVDAAAVKSFGSYTHNLRFNGSFFKYIWERRNWFSFATLNASHLDSYRQISSDVTSGFGYGRYIDATALAKAVRIEDHLIRDKIISDYLPKETMLRIASIIEREDEYKDLYGEDVYELSWLEDMEDEIQKTGLLIEATMSALGTIRMRQVLFEINEIVNDRYYGWDARLGVLFPITTSDKSTPGNPNLIISGQYAYPLNWQIQLNSRADIFTPIDSTFGKKVISRAGLDFIYELSSRVNFVLSYNLIAETLPSEKSTLDSELGLNFLYYLENKLYFTVNAGIRKVANGPTSMSNSIGLQYNLF